MMAQYTPCTVLVAALLVGTLSHCSAEKVYCVAPTATSCSSCPHSSTHCDTLSKYAQEAKTYFSSNVTIVFLPGVHALDVNITVANVSSLTLHGQSSSANIATIVCRGSVGLSFTSMVEFKIHSLAFTSCSRKYVTPLASSFALLLQSTQNTVLVNSFFHDNLGTALVVNTASVTLAEKNEFINNSADYGGGIYASDNAVLSINGTTNFINN